MDDRVWPKWTADYPYPPPPSAEVTKELLLEACRKLAAAEAARYADTAFEDEWGICQPDNPDAALCGARLVGEMVPDDHPGPVCEACQIAKARNDAQTES